MILDLGTHDADLLRFVLGRAAVAVSAVMASQESEADAVEDAVASAQLYEGNIVVTTLDSFNVAYGETSLEVHGSSGSLRGVGILRPEPIGKVWLTDSGGSRIVDTEPPRDPYERVIEALCEAVRSGARPLATGHDGLRSLVVGLAVRQAAVSGTTIVPSYP